MQSVVDVIGGALASYYNGDKQGQLIIREDSHSTSIPISHFFRNPDSVIKDRIALSYCKQSVLNIGAASGEHSLYLVEKGIEVTSLDTSPIACAIMTKRGLSPVICGDIFEQHANVERRFTWLALHNVIGQLGSIDKFCRFINLAKHHLLPGGRLILRSEDLYYEGYRTRNLSFEYDSNVSQSVPWFDIGITTLRHIAENNRFKFRIIYRDKHNKYIALLTRC